MPKVLSVEAPSIMIYSKLSYCCPSTDSMVALIVFSSLYDTVTTDIFMMFMISWIRLKQNTYSDRIIQ